MLLDFLWRARDVSALASPMIPKLPNPQLDDQWAVVGNLIPEHMIGLAVGHLEERGAIDPGHHPPVHDDVIVII